TSAAAPRTSLYSVVAPVLVTPHTLTEPSVNRAIQKSEFASTSVTPLRSSGNDRNPRVSRPQNTGLPFESTADTVPELVDRYVIVFDPRLSGSFSSPNRPLPAASTFPLLVRPKTAASPLCEGPSATATSINGSPSGAVSRSCSPSAVQPITVEPSSAARAGTVAACETSSPLAVTIVVAITNKTRCKRDLTIIVVFLSLS